VESCQLDEDAADPAVRAEEEDRLARPHPRGAVQHLPGGDAVHDDGLGVLRADAVGHDDAVAGGHEGVGRPGPRLRQGRDALAEQAPVGTVADGEHVSDEVVSGDEGEGGLAEVAALPHGLFREGDAGRLHLDEQLSGAGRRDGARRDDEAGRFDEAGEHDLGGGELGCGGRCGVHDGRLSDCV
jgi:hypothetical protein